MRIAVLSDIHGNLPALQAVVADLELRRVEQVINLGDNFSGPLLVRETADFLSARTDWIQLAGNHERQILEIQARGGTGGGKSDRHAYLELSAQHLQWIAGLSHTQIWREEILLCHASPGNDHTALLQTAERHASAAEIAQRLGQLPPAVKLVVCGHSHVPRVVHAGPVLIVNPGSVGRQAYSDSHPYPYRVESGSPDARYAILESGPQGWRAELISLPYPFAAMAQLAQERQRPHWAHALRTGYFDDPAFTLRGAD